jgi:hypothetical protein
MKGRRERVAQSLVIPETLRLFHDCCIKPTNQALTTVGCLSNKEPQSLKCTDSALPAERRQRLRRAAARKMTVRSTLEFYEGGCQEKILPADGKQKFSSTSRPWSNRHPAKFTGSFRVHVSVETTSAATRGATSSPGVKDAHDGSIRGSWPTALSGGARGPSVRRRLAPWWPLPKLQVETHPQPWGLAG